MIWFRKNAGCYNPEHFYCQPPSFMMCAFTGKCTRHKDHNALICLCIIQLYFRDGYFRPPPPKQNKEAGAGDTS